MLPLPHSLTAIRVFDAAAKHKSCSRAADELFLTQSAVSKQLQSLEHYLGVKLFRRVHQGLALTDAGAAYLQAVRPALSLLAEATQKARMYKAENSTIFLGLPETFGQKWLSHRLADFTKRHAEINVQLAPKPGASTDCPKFTAEIRGGRGTWDGMHAQYLMGRELYPVCSPAVAREISGKKPDQLANLRLLEYAGLPQMWNRWFAAMHVTGLASSKTQQFEQYSTLISALCTGLGVGLMPLCLIEHELAEGTLSVLFDDPVRTEYGYYFVYPKELPPTPSLTLFSNWLLEKSAESRSVQA